MLVNELWIVKNLNYVFVSQTGTSIQGHLDSITESCQPYLLAVGTQKSTISKYLIIIDKHAITCKSVDSITCFD